MNKIVLPCLLALCLAALALCAWPASAPARAWGAAVSPVADLSVTKTDSLDPVPPFGRMTYTITVNNAGPSAATGVRVTDTVPAGGNYVSGSPGKLGYNPIYWVVGDLAAGASKTLTFTMDLDSRAGNSLSNRVAVTAQETDPDTANNKYTEYTEIRATVDLSLAQSDSADPIAAGERLTYTLLARNNGPAIATGVKVTDTLPPGVTFYAATPGSTGTTTRLWNIGNLAAGAGKTITLVVMVDPSFEGTLRNRAAISGAVPETAPANNASEETTRAFASTDLGLVKSDNPDPVTSGGDLAYNLVVTNHGPSVALGVDVTDTLPAGVTLRAATPGYNGPHPMRWRIARLFPGASTTLTVTVRLDPEAVEPLINRASVSGRAMDPEPGNNSVAIQTGIQYRPAMVLLKSAPPSAAVGDTLVYSYTLFYDAAHADGSPVRELAVVDDVAGTAAYISGDDGDALLEPGEAWLWSAEHTVAPDDPDPLVAGAVASGLDLDGDALAARAGAQTDIHFRPALAVVKTGPAAARLGETIAYSVAVRNDSAHGDGSAIGQVAVADDRGVVGSPVKTGGNSDASLEVGEVWIYPVSYRPRMGDPDPLVNVARVTALDRDGGPLAAEDSHSLRLDLAPALLVAKTGPAVAEVGQRVVYTCTLAQDTLYGDSTPIADLSVTDSVAGAMTLVQMSGGDNDALLEVGETWTYTAAYTIRPDDPDPLVNVARAEGRDESRDVVSGAAEHALDIRHMAALTLDKTGPAGAAFGQAVVYTITVGYDAAGSDGSAIRGVVVTDTLTTPPALAARKGGDSDDLLEPGETWVYTATRTIADDDRDPLVNTARATAQDRDGDPLAAQDSHTVRLPGLLLGAVTKAGDPVCADSRAYYAVILANAGAVPLTNVVVAARLPEHATLVGAESTFGYVVDGPRDVHWSIPRLDVGRQAPYNVALLIGPEAAGSTLELCIGAQADQVPLATRCASTTVISCVTPPPDRGVKLRLPILVRR